MDEEMQSLFRNHTWDVVALPLGKQAVGCKWVHAKKHHADGTLVHYKSRLVAWGSTQSYGINCFETSLRWQRWILSISSWHLLLTSSGLSHSLTSRTPFCMAIWRRRCICIILRGILSDLQSLSVDCKSPSMG